MDRSRLREDIDNFKRENSEHISKEQKKSIRNDAINKWGDGTGDINILMAIEELAELQQELIKYLRDGEFSIGLEEELVDASMGISYVKDILLNDKDKKEELKYIEDVKYLRQEKRNLTKYKRK